MAAPVNTPTKYTGATGFVEIALPTAQAKETDTLIHFVYKGAQHDASASGITSTNFVITDVSGTLLPSYLVTFTAYNNMQLHIRFPNVSTSAAQYVYLQYGSGITRSNDSAALTGDDMLRLFTHEEASGNFVDIATADAAVPATATGYGATGAVGFAGRYDSANLDWSEFTSPGVLADYSLLMMINFNSATPGNQGILEWSDSSSRRYGIFSLGGQMLGSYVDSGGLARHRRTSSTTSLNSLNGAWHMLGVNVVSSAIASLTIDGVSLALDATIYSNGAAATASTAYIGRATTSSLFQANALIDSVMLFSSGKSVNYNLRAYNNENGFATDAIFTVSDTTAFASGRLVGASALFGSVLIGQSSLIG